MPAGMVELLHVESGRVIVRVSAGSGAALVSALAEAASAELAEDRARQRLHQPVGAVSAAAPTLTVEPVLDPSSSAPPVRSSPTPSEQQPPPVVPRTTPTGRSRHLPLLWVWLSIVERKTRLNSEL